MVVAKSECPDLGILNLTSLVQHVTFCASQKPQDLRKVLTKDASQTVRSHKFGSRKDGCRKLRMSSLMNLEPYIFAKHVAFCACRKPQNLRTVNWKVMTKEAIETVGRCKVGSRTVAECPDLGSLNLTSFAQHVAF